MVALQKELGVESHPHAYVWDRQTRYGLLGVGRRVGYYGEMLSEDSRRPIREKGKLAKGVSDRLRSLVESTSPNLGHHLRYLLFITQQIKVAWQALEHMHAPLLWLQDVQAALLSCHTALEHTFEKGIYTELSPLTAAFDNLALKIEILDTVQRYQSHFRFHKAWDQFVRQIYAILFEPTPTSQGLFRNRFFHVQNNKELPQQATSELVPG